MNPNFSKIPFNIILPSGYHRGDSVLEQSKMNYYYCYHHHHRHRRHHHHHHRHHPSVYTQVIQASLSNSAKFFCT